MTLDDLALYLDYIKAHSDDGVFTIRVIHSYPDDYIALLREIEQLRSDLSRYQSSAKIDMRLLSEVSSGQELAALRLWLKEHHISIDGFQY